MLDKGLIGRRSEPVINEVEKGAVRRFAQSLGITDELHFDDRAAEAAGLRGLLAPPTFPTTFRSSIDLRDALALGDRGLLHADQSFEYFRQICAGDRIQVVAVIAEVSERAGAAGPMDVVVVEDEGRDEHGHLVYRGRKTLIVRPGSPGNMNVAVARKLYYENVRVGDELQPLLKPALDRVAIARYAGASDDYNPNHVDEDYARRSGFPGISAHFMMAMGYLGQLCADWVRAGQVKRLSTRSVKLIWPGDQLTCRGRVVDKRREGGEYYVDLELWVENQKGELVVKGNATTRLYHSPEDEDRQRRGLSPLIVEDDLRPSLVEVFERELPRIEVPARSAARSTGRSRARVAVGAEEEPLPASKAPPARTAAKTAKAAKKK